MSGAEPTTVCGVGFGDHSPCASYRQSMLLRLVLVAAAFGAAVAGPAAAQQPIEPIDVPPSVEQGVDMVYVDPEIMPFFRQRDAEVQEFAFDPWTGAPVDMFMPVHPL